MTASGHTLRISSFLLFGAVVLVTASAANAHTLDGLVINRNDLEFNAASGEMRYFHCSAVIMSNGATEGLGAGGSTGGAGLISSVNTIGNKLVARFNFNGVFTSRQDFGGNHRIRVTFGSAALDFVGTNGSSTGFLYGTAVLTADGANPVTEDPASVPVGTVCEVRFAVTLLNGALFGPGMFSNNFNFEIAGVVDCSRPKRAGFNADCNGNGIIDAIDIAETLETDCNDNGVPDSCDILQAVSLDCDENAVPDECDPDCNGNALPDACDISDAASQDCNTNAIPDECEPDCNESGIPDDCDIENGISLDCNQNDLPDECDVSFARFNLAGTLASLQANNAVLSNLIPTRYDFTEGQTGSRILNGGNNMYNGGNILNTNLATELQYSNNLISPNMGAFGPGSQYFTAKYDGLFIMIAHNLNISYFRITGTIPTGGLGVSDTLKLSVNDRGKYYDVFVRRIWAAYRPSINHLIIVPAGPDDVVQTVSLFTNNEQDEVGPLGNVNEIYYLLTSRSDGTPLSAESATQLAKAFLELRQVDALDCNENGVPDECDIASAEIGDCNNNQIPDDCEPQADCNANGVMDICESLADCDYDGISDACEIENCAHGDLSCLDCDENGMPDGCELINAGSALSFNGDYVIVPNSPALSISGSLTLEVWATSVNPAASSQQLVFKGDGQSGLDPYFLRLSGNNLEFALNGDGNTLGQVVTNVAAYNWTQFHHIAGVFDDSADQLSIYIDGQLVATNTTTFRPLTNQASMNLWIGSATTEQYYNGKLDEVRIWNTARTAQQIHDWKSRRLAGNENNLVGYWKFDEASGQVATDHSSFHNNGTFGSGSGSDGADPLRVSPGVPIGLADCNNNGRLDSCDVNGVISADCNDNMVPDECESQSDCNHNGWIDICEAGGPTDCDADGTSNWCEIDAGAGDCNGDLTPNSCEIAVPNAALVFDGSNDLVVLPDDTIRSRTTLTVEAWFKTSAGGVILGYQNAAYPTSPSNYVPAIYVGTDGKLRAQFNNNVSAPITTANTVNNGAWHHVALVGAVNAQQLYLDGVLVNSTPLAGTINHLTMTKNQIGTGRAGNTWPASPSSYYVFNGQIDEVRIWSVARTAAEVAANRNKSFSGSVQGLVGYWKLNSGSGQSAADSSGFNQHGVLGTTAGVDTSDPTWVTNNSESPSPADCNGNTIPDTCDLAAGTSVDCDANGIPDECENDCNNNGIADGCDITAGTSLDCNNNGVPDSCDFSAGTSVDVNSNTIPDECEPDIRIVPIITLVDPIATTEVRLDEPISAEAVTRGGYYYVEVWAIDLGSTNTGLSGAYVDINFCSQTTAAEVHHGTIYTVFPSGTLQAGKVDEFGGSALPGDTGVSPQWVRIGWLKMLANLDVPSCDITLTQGAGGVAALGRGLIPNSLISRGSATIEIAPPLRTYDLDNSTIINVGDLSLFASSWQEGVPPGDEAHDFDCNEFVGVSDLSWFATGWLKGVNDPTIQYPPCVDSGGGRGAPEGIDAKFRITVRSTSSGADTVMTLPTSLTSISAGQQFHVEVWASDVGDVNTGLTSAYVDLSFPPEANVLSINHHGVFNVLGSGTDSGGILDEIGGSTLAQDTATEPMWTRIASVRMLAADSRPVFVFGLSPSNTGVASYGRGELPWSTIELQPISIGTATAGDIDADGDIDQADLTLFANVLLGTEANAGRISRSDMNGDTQSNGADVQEFVEAMLE